MACAISSLLFCCLLLVAPHLGGSYRASYTDDENHVIYYRSPAGGASPPMLCLDIPSGDDDDGITTSLPVFHRLSPCSPHPGAQNQGNTSVADVLNRDSYGLFTLEARGMTVTSSEDGSFIPYFTFVGSSEYHVVVGYGTPPQRLAVGFDIMSTGMSLLICKRCVGAVPCHRTFDPSRSSSLEGIPFDSPDCRLKRSCSGSICMTPRYCTESMIDENGTAELNTTVVTDKLALSKSTTVHKFRFACLETGSETVDDTVSGILDVGQHRHSLASRAPPSPNTVAFSYCLPSATTSHGFLSFAAVRPELSGHSMRYTTLRHKRGQPNMYFVRLTGIMLSRKSIPVPYAAFTGESIIVLRTTFTYLRRGIYTVLRDEFEGQMKQYSHLRVQPVGGLETCYNFSGLGEIVVPSIHLQFDGGAVMELGFEQMMYLQEPHSAISVACLAFAPSPQFEAPVAVIGTLAQAKTEVAYHLLGRVVGFAPNAC